MRSRIPKWIAVKERTRIVMGIRSHGGRPWTYRGLPMDCSIEPQLQQRILMAATHPTCTMLKGGTASTTRSISKLTLHFLSGAFGLVCSAKDQLGGTAVAIKKIMKPFSTPVLSKRTYRELKLLKHLRHENVSGGEKDRSHVSMEKLILCLSM